MKCEELNQIRNVITKKYKWDRECFAQEYVNLLYTPSDHLSLDNDTRIQFLKSIENHIQTEFGEGIVKEYLAILYKANRRCKLDHLGLDSL